MHHTAEVGGNWREMRIDTIKLCDESKKRRGYEISFEKVF
jgi:hypothetical protein